MRHEPPIPHLVMVPGHRDHIRGPEYAPVMLVEYGDFECPSCGAAHPEVEEVRQRMGDQVGFVFRHFPVTSSHPHAQLAAEAAEAAGSQERFWPMHDLLFLHQDALGYEDLIEYARELGLDVRRFGRELANGIHTARVREDVLSGARSGVNGTPTFFVNGLRHEGPWDVASLTAAIHRAMGTHVGGS